MTPETTRRTRAAGVAVRMPIRHQAPSPKSALAMRLDPAEVKLAMAAHVERLERRQDARRGRERLQGVGIESLRNHLIVNLLRIRRRATPCPVAWTRVGRAKPTNACPPWEHETGLYEHRCKIERMSGRIKRFWRSPPHCDGGGQICGCQPRHRLR